MQKITSLQARLHKLLHIAKSNRWKQQNFHEYEMALLNSTSLHELLVLILEKHQSRGHFHLNDVTLMIYDPDYEFQCLVESQTAQKNWRGRLRFTTSLKRINKYFDTERKPMLAKYSPDRHAYLFSKKGKLGWIALLPLFRQNQLYGCLNLASHNPSFFNHKINILLLEHFAAVVSNCIENARLHEHVEQVGLYDALTGINNRRFFDQRLDEEVSRAQRTGSPLSCLFIDLDHFKKVNDEHGHQSGDAVLRQLCQLLSERLRKTDVLARYGGEEFVVLLADTSEEQALLIAEQIRDLVEKNEFDISCGKTLKITMSIGVSTMLVPGEIRNGNEFIAMADRAVYDAKLSGRNRVKKS